MADMTFEVTYNDSGARGTAMSDNLRKRVLGPASTNFKPKNILKAADLNEAFEGLRWEAALRATSTGTPSGSRRRSRRSTQRRRSPPVTARRPR